MAVFNDSHERIRFAKHFTLERLNSLDKDARYCLLDNGKAPFPALLYCFATIDLLGALYAGDASKNAKTAAQSVNYLRDFMHYPEKPSNLLMLMLRHKVVHLAEPRAVVEFDGAKTTWKLWHANSERHLRLELLPQPFTSQLTSGIKLIADHLFEVSILDMVQDIKESVVSPNGYLDKLEQDAAMQTKFDSAVAQIYA
jgi:hypothetical protein